MFLMGASDASLTGQAPWEVEIAGLMFVFFFFAAVIGDGAVI